MRVLSLALAIVMVVSGCSSSPTYREPAFAKARTGLDKGGFSQVLKKFGYRVYFGNLHAHHYMGPVNPNDPNHPPETEPTQCTGSYPQDDGRPCRNDSSGENKVVTHPNGESALPITNYFKEACRYGANEGELNVLWITPHSKNNGVQVQANQKPDTDTVQGGYEERHRLLPELNATHGKDGRFFCGLGQEASSISAGNHINIFGHFKVGNGETHPFFFPTGDFGKLYSEVKDRRAHGEKVVLQFNHPESNDDTWWKSTVAGQDEDPKELQKKLKEKLNDYGLDDFAPVGCIIKKARNLPVPAGCTGQEPDKINTQLLKQTFANIREASGDPMRLIEVISPRGATDNPTTEFRKVHDRTDPNAYLEGLRDYVFYLYMGFRLSPTANQDNHHMNWGSATASRTGILAKTLDEDSLLDAFDGRRTFATEDVNAAGLLSIGDTFMGGETETADDNAILSIAYKDLDAAEKSASIRAYIYHEEDKPDFYYNSKPESWVQIYPAAAKVDSGSATLLRVPLKKGKQFIFVELTQADNDKIITAPIWVTRK